MIAKKTHSDSLRDILIGHFFYLPDIRKYYHEDDLSEEETKKYNPRYKAVKKLQPIVKKYLEFKRIFKSHQIFSLFGDIINNIET